VAGAGTSSEYDWQRLSFLHPVCSPTEQSRELDDGFEKLRGGWIGFIHLPLQYVRSVVRLLILRKLLGCVISLLILVL
jgi:hypothetical protein